VPTENLLHVAFFELLDKFKANDATTYTNFLLAIEDIANRQDTVAVTIKQWFIHRLAPELETAIFNRDNLQRTESEQ